MIALQPNTVARTLPREPTLGPEGGVRLGTLIAIRWLAVLGQGTALLVVAFGLELDLDLFATLGVVSISAILNLILSIGLPANKRLSEKAAWLHLAFDLTHLAWLLSLTGGLTNPFSLLMLAPTTVCASVLSRRATYSLTAYALCLLILVSQFSLPLPWKGTPPDIPPLLLAGITVGLGFTLVFLALYLARIGHEGRNRERALAVTQIALEREQKLSALGALAAAAAHELGTPLGTIMLASKETLRQDDLPPDVREDLELIFTEVRRCQATLRTLSIEASGEDPFSVQTAEAILREAAAPHEGRGISVEFQISPGRQPRLRRHAELVHGLRNIIENAVDYAATAVTLSVDWTDTMLSICVQDDGRGFDPAVIRKLGEPYITTRPKRGNTGGLGLGLFIASTLLERTGARITFDNAPGGGAFVILSWALEPGSGGQDEGRTKGSPPVAAREREEHHV